MLWKTRLGPREVRRRRSLCRQRSHPHAGERGERRVRVWLRHDARRTARSRGPLWGGDGHLRRVFGGAPGWGRGRATAAGMPPVGDTRGAESFQGKNSFTEKRPASTGGPESRPPARARGGSGDRDGCPPGGGDAGAAALGCLRADCEASQGEALRLFVLRCGLRVPRRGEGPLSAPSGWRAPGGGRRRPVPRADPPPRPAALQAGSVCSPVASRRLTNKTTRKAAEDRRGTKP